MRGSSEIGATLEVSAHRPSEMNGETSEGGGRISQTGRFSLPIQFPCYANPLWFVRYVVLCSRHKTRMSILYGPDHGHARNVPDSTNCREGCPRPKTKCGGSDATSKPDNSQLGVFFF